MGRLVAGFKWIMLVAGVLTATMAWGIVDPQGTLRSMFGVALEGAVADIVVRNWAALIAGVGAGLVYAAFRPAARPLVLVFAGASKLVFIGLVLVYGRAHLGGSLVASIVVDALMVCLFAAYLIETRKRA